MQCTDLSLHSKSPKFYSSFVLQSCRPVVMFVCLFVFATCLPVHSSSSSMVGQQTPSSVQTKAIMAA